MNTKITFYCTQHQYGSFEKVIFDTVVSDEINNLSDAKKWLSDEIINKVYYEFDLDLVFEWVIIHQSKTNEPCYDIKEIKRIDGKLEFKTERKKKQSSQYFLTDKELAKKVAKTAKKKNEPAPKPKKEYRSCWIDLLGKIHWVGFAEHNNFAYDWLKKHDEIAFKKIENNGYTYHYEELESRGWIKILGWVDPPNFVLPEIITPKQKNSLRDYCVSQKVSYEFFPDILKN